VVELVPVLHVKSQVATDGLKIGVVAGDDGGADASGGKRDQYVKGQLTQFFPVKVFPLSDNLEQLAGVQPVMRGWCQNLTPPGKITDESLFDVTDGSAGQFVQNDR